MIERVDFESEYFELYRINGNAYAAISSHEDNISNAGFVDLGDKVVVYDTFLSLEAAKDMAKAVHQFAGTEDIILAISHWHSDHYLGNCAFSKETNIIASDAAYRLIRERMPELPDKEEVKREILQLEADLEKETDEKKILGIRNSLKFHRNFVHPELELRYPNIALNGELRVIGRTGDVALEVIEMAHSQGDMIAVVGTVMFAGDLIFADNHPFMGTGDPLKWKTELLRFLDMEIDYFVPGHGGICGKAEVQNKIEYIDALIDLVQGNMESEKELFVSDLPEKFHHYRSPSFEWNVKFLREYLGNPK